MQNDPNAEKEPIAPETDPAGNAEEMKETPEAAEPEAEENGGKKKKAKKEKKKRPLWWEILSWVLTLLGAVAIALVIRTTLFEMVSVYGESMKDTLQNGEIMFVTKTEYSSFWFSVPFTSDDAKEGAAKVALFGNPRRFDAVICRYPDRGTTNFVKRVVGLPGDIVELADGYLYVNGERYEEPYINDSYRRGAGASYGPSLVPSRGDTVTFDGERFLVNGDAYSYAHAMVELSGTANMTIRRVYLSHRQQSGLNYYIGADYMLVTVGGETYILQEATDDTPNVWYRVVGRQVYKLPNNASSYVLESGTEIVADAEHFSYTPATGKRIDLQAERIETVPVAVGDYTVTEDHYFVMGDHRNASNDSRQAGAIPRTYVMGHVRHVIWPLSEWRPVPNGLELPAVGE